MAMQTLTKALTGPFPAGCDPKTTERAAIRQMSRPILWYGPNRIERAAIRQNGRACRQAALRLPPGAAARTQESEKPDSHANGGLNSGRLKAVGGRRKAEPERANSAFRE